MAKEAGADVQHSIQKLRQHGGIAIAGAKALQQRCRRFQFLALQVFRHMCGQRAVRAVQQDARLPFHQQAQLRKFVFENGRPSHQPMHKSFPSMRLNADTRCTNTRRLCGITKTDRLLPGEESVLSL